MMIRLGHEPLGPQGGRYGYGKLARRPFNVHDRITRATSHTCPTHAAWRRGATGDAHSLVAATHAHGEASALHPRRDHPLRASLRKLGGDACLAAPLVCGHAAARCGLHVRRCWCPQASLPARSAGRTKRDVTANTRGAQTGRCLRAGRRPPPSGVPPQAGESTAVVCEHATAHVSRYQPRVRCVQRIFKLAPAPARVPNSPPGNRHPRTLALLPQDAEAPSPRRPSTHFLSTFQASDLFPTLFSFQQRQPP